MQATPLSGALGAKIRDLDLTKRLADDEISEIHDRFLEHHLLCLESACLSDGDFARVARYFGTPQIQLIRRSRSQAVPEVSTLESTYKSADDKPDDLTLVRLSGWHTDDSYFAVPAKATMLQALDVPAGIVVRRQGSLTLEAGENPKGVNALRHAASDRQIAFSQPEHRNALNDAGIARGASRSDSVMGSRNAEIEGDFSGGIVGDGARIVMVGPELRIVIVTLKFVDFVFGFDIAMFGDADVNTHAGRIDVGPIDARIGDGFV